MLILYLQVKWTQHHDCHLALQMKHCTHIGRYTIDGVRLCATYK